MKIAIPAEQSAESRVAATPDTVQRLKKLGAEVTLQSGAGRHSGYLDSDYEAAGAQIAKTAKATLKDADFILKVRRPALTELKDYPSGACLIGLLDPYDGPEELEALANAGLTSFAMELMPRITRAQSMDVLSSQANLAGYQAVIEGAHSFGRAMPMMMTAAGTVPAARVFVMGAGVAGLQAIATARRLGAVVTATDVRPASREQVESLGAKFIAVQDDEFRQAETSGGYAREMSDSYKAKQAELVAGHIAKQDIVITTALIPGRPAPRLVSQGMVESMKPGSVIVDLAIERGGNCELSRKDETVIHQDVRIVALSNMAGRIPASASALYARNLYTFFETLVDRTTGKSRIHTDDEILRATCLTAGGKIVHASFTPQESTQENTHVTADQPSTGTGEGTGSG